MDDDIDISALTIEQCIALISNDIKPGIVNPKIGNDIEFEINANFLRELRRKIFAGTDDKDAYKHVRMVLEIVDLFHFPGVTHDAIMLRKVHIFYIGLDISTRKILDSNRFIPLTTPTQALESIQAMADHLHDWYDETTTKERINDVLDNVDAIHESFKGEHLTKDDGGDEVVTMMEMVVMVATAVGGGHGGEAAVVMMVRLVEVAWRGDGDAVVVGGAWRKGGGEGEMIWWRWGGVVVELVAAEERQPRWVVRRWCGSGVMEMWW
ncbi:hypothetical protein Tco_0433193 [Tanacetum coccineum]